MRPLWREGGAGLTLVSMRKAGDPLLLEQRRFHAIGLHEQGVAPSVIAAGLGVHPQSVRLWLRHYAVGGLDALRARLHPGPTPRLSDEQKQTWLTLLAQPPSAYGQSGVLWTAAAMATLLRDRFGVRYHPSHVGSMMHELGYSQQLPSKKPRERDPQKITQWKDQHWPGIVQRLRETQATVVFVDEAGFLMNPLRKKLWAPRGQTPQVLYRSRHHMKVSVIGGLYAGLDPAQIGLLTQWYPGENVNAERVVAFLEALLKQLSGNLMVVWDNLSAHRSKLLKTWLKTQSRLHLEALPPYAPDLNPIELVWCMSKYHRLANHTLADIERLQEAAQHAVDEVAMETNLLHSCIRNAGLHSALYPPGEQ